MESPAKIPAPRLATATTARLPRRRFLLLAAALPVALAGCGKTGKEAAQSSPGAGTGGATGGNPGVLRYALTEEPPTLDPHLSFSARTGEMLQNTFEGLVHYDADNKLAPLLAAAMPELSADGKTYTVKLKPGVRFHDGTPLTADVVRANALRILSKALASPQASQTLYSVVGAKDMIDGKSDVLPGVQVVDEQTVRFILSEPRSYFLNDLAGFSLISPKALADAPKNERGVGELDAKTAIGTGPFKIAEYTRQGRVVQTANPDYHGAKPLLTRIERHIVVDNKTARNLYESGQLDMLLETVSDYEIDKNDPAKKAELRVADEASFFYVTLGQKAFAPFKDARVRQALSCALDRSALGNDAMAGMYPPATGILAPGIVGANPPDAAPEPLQLNPERAKKLLAEAGYTAQKPLAFTLSYSQASPTAAKAAQVMKEQWAAVGVLVTLQESEWGALLKRIQNHDFEAVYSGWSSTPDPHSTLFNLLDSASTNNEGEYRSAAFDALSRAADRETDPAKRAALTQKAVAVVLEEAPILPVVFARDVRLVRPQVTGLQVNLGGLLPHTTTKVA